MRLLLLTTNRHFQSLLGEILPQYGLTATSVAVRAALEDREQPVVLLHAERWDEEVANLVRRLLTSTPHVYVICPQATDLRVVLAILKTDAADAAADTALALHALALKLRRIVRESEPWQWQLGSRRFVPADGCLYDYSKRIALTTAEVRLLRRLCLVSETESPGRLTIEQLAWELGGKASSRASSARNYITQLRRKLGDDPDWPTILRRDKDGYWVVLRPPQGVQH